MKRIAILGSTGSIGRSALAVVDAHPNELQITGLAAGENVELLAAQIERYRPQLVALASGRAVDRLRSSGPSVKIAEAGRDGLVSVATHPDVDVVLCASSGTDALEAVLEAIAKRKTIALANKEVLVMAGGLVMDAAKRHGVPILPVDSEHNALHQCLHGRTPADVRRLVLTASGGPFRGWSTAQLDRVTAADALKHPTWQMGRKITIDSATLMNKGLEVIEAHWLFEVGSSRIEVLVHPQSVVHSLVELVDGSMIAQLGITDMRLPIQYAFSYPERWASPLPSLNLAEVGRLDFTVPDRSCFPCLGLAYRALESDRSLPVVLNAANEVAVGLFLEGRIGFRSIPTLIEQAMDAHVSTEVTTLAGVRAVDEWARRHAMDVARAVELKV